MSGAPAFDAPAVEQEAYVMNRLPVYDFCDFPTGWAICRMGIEHVDPRCSWVQASGGFLCDCGAVEAEWTRRRKAAGLSHDRYQEYLERIGLWPVL